MKICNRLSIDLFLSTAAQALSVSETTFRYLESPLKRLKMVKVRVKVIVMVVIDGCSLCSKHEYGFKLIADSKLAIGVNTAVNDCFYVLATDWQSVKVYPACPPMGGIGSNPPVG